MTRRGRRGVLLVGNYAPDRQESMGRFTGMLASGLEGAGVICEVVTPPVRCGGWGGEYRHAGVTKWLGYGDKYLGFPPVLAGRARAGWRLHVIDHSNAMYCREGRGDVVTCHDLLAVRGARGEATDCPASATGVWLQRWIMRGLARAAVVVCASHTTAADARRLLPAARRGRVRVVPNGLNYPYGQQAGEEGARRRAELGLSGGYVLHVGSNLVRKNKAAVLHAVARAGSEFGGEVVLAGPTVPGELWELARRLGVAGRVREVVAPDNATLEALYAGAQALVFPSRWEGFGWPIIEAQACGCPVVCGEGSALPEVAGGGAILCGPDDHGALGRAVVEMGRPEARAVWIARGRENVAGYTTAAMVAGYVAVYAGLDAEETL